MNCRTFRKHHVSYVDDTASGFARAQLDEHLRACERCANHDARVRRALLVVRNLPPIEPSAGFRDRLHSRLVASALMPERAMARRMRYSGIMAAAAVLLSVGTVAGVASMGQRPMTLTMPPVVASSPPVFPSVNESPVLAMPEVVASFSTGLALWPAALVADEAAEYFVNATFAQDELTR
jgi:anti-sigma factor RsiW